MQNNKTAIITGSGRGIGKAIAIGLAADGYDIALVSRTEKELQETAHQIAKINSKIKTWVFPINVADEKSVTSCVGKIASESGSVNVLVNNAGIYRQGTCDIDLKTFEEVIKINLTGSFNFCKAVVPYLKEQQSGYIFNIASVRGIKAAEGIGAYCASKFALRGLGESLFYELLPYNVKVTTISPSWVETDMTKGSSSKPKVTIMPQDIFQTVQYVMKLGVGACVREIAVDCSVDPL